MLERVAASAVDEIVVVEGAYELVARCRRTPVSASSAAPTGSAAPERRSAAGSGALDDDVEAAVVIMADGPDLSPAAVARVVEDWRAHGGSVVAASYAETAATRSLVARAAWANVPDDGLRVVSPRLVPCDDLGAPGDVDTPAELPRDLSADQPSQ